jgi:glycosyltransferase involved in cell wall biosynthesis
MNNDLPLVSIAIITYNQKDFLKDAVESVLAQTYKNIEIVVGDDCSPDGSQEMLREYDKKYPGKFVLQLAEKNIGITGNSNAVHHACTGKYIAWLGGDDLFNPDKIEKQVAFMEAHHDHNIVYHNLDVFESPSGKHLFFFNNKSNTYTGDVRTMIKHGTFNGACSTMVRHSASPAYGFDSDIPLASDWLYWIEHLINGGKIGYINEVLGKYRRHNKNVTSGVSEHAPQGYLDLLKTCEILQQKYPQYQKEINHRLSIIYRTGRKYGYVENLIKSLKHNIFNFPAAAVLAIHLLSFKKIKL